MAEVTKVTCDQCGADLTTTGNCEDWSLVVGNRVKTPWYRAEGLSGGAVTSMATYPPIDRKHDFCDLDCLAVWLADKRPNARAAYDRKLAWRERCERAANAGTSPFEPSAEAG